MYRTTIFAILALALSTPLAADDTSEITQLGAAFCNLVKSGRQDADLIGILTPSLIESITEALARNDAIQASAPDEKPPLGDGVQWSSWPDSPDACTIEAIEIEGDIARMPISYRFENQADADYTDMLNLQATPDGWRVDDAIFIDCKTLRSTLINAFEP